MCFLLGSPCPSCVQRGKAQSCSCDISAFPGKNKANPALLSAAARQNASLLLRPLCEKHFSRG